MQAVRDGSRRSTIRDQSAVSQGPRQRFGLQFEFQGAGLALSGVANITRGLHRPNYRSNTRHLNTSRYQKTQQKNNQLINPILAAGLGNLISDVAGIGSAWYVENIASRIGVLPPPLTPEQMRMRSTRWCAQLSRALGVSLGCLLGMVPLIFLPRHKSRSKKSSDEEMKLTS
uniref:Transmembrane protein 65 n=1 Tax=Strigamia maritima TaxID=126957 RepID=T1J8U6_STRMM